MINQRKDRCFQEAWLEESEFKDWLRKDKTHVTKFRCAICSKSLTLSTSGRAPLIDHAKGSKHKTELSKVASFFNKKASISLTTSSSARISPSPTSETSKPVFTTLDSNIHIFRSDFLLLTKEFFGWKI